MPDVWLPDSSTWMQRLRASSPSLVPGEAISIASSPIVVALPEPSAAALRGDGKITWQALVGRVTTNPKLRLGITEPSRDAAGLSSLVALSAAAAAAGSNAQSTNVAALRALASGRAQLRDELLKRFPRAGDAATLSSSLSMAPLSEQAVISYNAAQPPVALVPLYVDPPPAPLDYPMTFMPDLDADKRAVAAQLRDALAGQAFKDRLAERGLRAANGTYGKAFPPGRAAPETAPSPLQAPDVNALDRALATWSAVTAPSRMLAVLDVSGSMRNPVPTAANATRMQLTVAAARRGLALFDNNSAMGLWTFATNLNGPVDHQELVPIGVLAGQREPLNQALTTIQPKPDGNTGLYDTTLAAYKAVQSTYDEGRVNSVAILTDGENKDDTGLSLDQLLAELRGVLDSRKPVQMVFVGIGSREGEAAMTRIAETTGGGVFIAEDPAKIDEIFLKAISLRPANPVR